MKPIIRKLVLVRWVDSAQPRSRWQYMDEVGNPPSIACESVGWIVSQTKQTISLAPNFADVDSPETIQVCGVITIPMRAVVSVRRIKLDDTAS